MSATLAPSRSRELATAVYEVIADLPDDSTAIARLLHDLGIRGKRGDGAWCPLSNFIRWRLPEVQYLHVDGHQIFVGGGDRFIDAPEQAAAFVYDFDEGYYPTLVEHLALPAPGGAP